MQNADRLSCWLAAALSYAQSTTTVSTTRSTTAPVTLTYRGCIKLTPTARDQLDRAFELHGLSGISYAGADSYWSVLDNNDKLVRLTVKLNADGSIASAIVTGGLTLADYHDNEGIALAKNGKSVFVSEEDTPGVHEYALADGRLLRSLETPDVFLNGHTVVNRGFESLSMTPDGKSLWTANEHALTVDGSTKAPAEPMGSTTRVRLLRYAMGADGSATPVEQFVYQTAGVHELAGFNSLTDMVALSDRRLLTLERSAGENLMGVKSFRSRIFLVTIVGATDVSRPPFDKGLPALGGPAVGKNSKPGPATRPLHFVRKQLLFEGAVCEKCGQNLEGLCLGPALGESRYAVLGVVDDTDGPMGLSHNYVVAFELDLSGTGVP